ncbi:TatD related DNase [Giardia muris]|uniref:TatD related DNase n=1 Tax=Giardia muris TaxID=5742 RepID=A0A4Z1T0R1_GIAMU|nr:TatD related DNase [Giardia muris]|eukprot:TNJ29288.1 TatD related DNase [Giardia muris]
MLSDAHCHFSPTFRDKWFSTSCRYLINATGPSQFAELKGFRQDHDNVRVGYGLHPYYLSDAESPSSLLILLRQYLEEDSTAFVGEIGLDTRPNAIDDYSLDLQLEFFRPQLQLAFALDRMVTIHIISRKPGLWPILINEFKEASRQYPKYQGAVILHAFNGSADVFEQLGQALSGCKARLYNSVSHFQLDSKYAPASIRAAGPTRTLIETDWYRPDLDDWNDLIEKALKLVSDVFGIDRDEALLLTARNWEQLN